MEPKLFQAQNTRSLGEVIDELSLATYTFDTNKKSLISISDTVFLPCIGNCCLVQSNWSCMQFFIPLKYLSISYRETTDMKPAIFICSWAKKISKDRNSYKKLICYATIPSILFLFFSSKYFSFLYFPQHFTLFYF